MVYCVKCIMDVPNSYHWREKYKHSKVCCRCVSEIDLPCISKYQREIIDVFNLCSSSFEHASSSEIYETCKKISENYSSGMFFFEKYMKNLSIEKINRTLSNSFGENFHFDDLTDDQLKQWIYSLDEKHRLFDYFEEDDVTREEMQEFIVSNVYKEIDYDELLEYTWYLANNTPPFYYIENLQESDMMNAFEKMNLSTKNVHFNLL